MAWAKHVWWGLEPRTVAGMPKICGPGWSHDMFLILPKSSKICMWVCLKMGYTPNEIAMNSRDVGIMISKTIGCRGLAYFQTKPCVYASSCKFDVHVETKMNPTFSDKTRFGIFSNIFLVLRFFFCTGLHGAQPIKTFVSNWKTMFCSWAEEIRSLFLVQTRMRCSGCSKLTLICPISLSSYKWLKFRHIDWYEKAWGGQVVQQMRAKDRTFETVRNLYGFCHIWWHVYSTFCIWGVPCPAVVCCCDDWEIDFNVCYFCLTFCQSEISWLRHTRASIARVSVGEPQCVGVPPKAHWVDMTKNAKKWNNQR